MKRTIMAAVVAVIAVAAIGRAQAAKPIDYETYCKLPDADAKKAAFMATTAESRGILVKTQMERWRDANLARLDDKQKAVFAELIPSITADSYANSPEGEAARVKTRTILSRFEPLFTQADLMAMQPNAPCIAKK